MPCPLLGGEDGTKFDFVSVGRGKEAGEVSNDEERVRGSAEWGAGVEFALSSFVVRASRSSANGSVARMTSAGIDTCWLID